MPEDKAPLIEAISKLELASGDVLVVKLPRDLSMVQSEHC